MAIFTFTYYVSRYVPIFINLNVKRRTMTKKKEETLIEPCTNFIYLRYIINPNALFNQELPHHSRK